MDSQLSHLVLSKFQGALTQEEANQLAILIFCTIDWLPEDLKHLEWTREKISSEFAALTKDGFVQTPFPAQKEAAYWNGIIDKFMADTITVDENFRNRLAL